MSGTHEANFPPKAVEKDGDETKKIKEEVNDDMMSEADSTQTVHSFRVDLVEAKLEEETRKVSELTRKKIGLEEKVGKIEDKLQRAYRAAGEHKLRADLAEERLDSKYGIKENFESEKNRADLLETKLEEETRKVSELTLKLAEYEKRADASESKLGVSSRKIRELTREKMNLNKELAARDDHGKKLQKRNAKLSMKLAQYGDDSDDEDESMEDDDEYQEILQEIDREEYDIEEIYNEYEEPSEQRSEERSGEDKEKEKKMDTRLNKSLTKPPQKRNYMEDSDENEETLEKRRRKEIEKENDEKRRRYPFGQPAVRNKWDDFVQEDMPSWAARDTDRFVAVYAPRHSIFEHPEPLPENIQRKSIIPNLKIK